jgi:hypothetical protein
MGTLTAISPAISYPSYTATSKGAANTAAQALVAAGTALQAASVSDTAASAQAAVQQTQPTTRPAPTNEAADADYSNLVNDVENGNLADAQAALAKLEIDLKTPPATHHSHAEAASPTPTNVTTDALSATTDSTGASSDSSTSGNYLNVTV